MTSRTFEATDQGPLSEAAVNQSPFSTAYHCDADTLRIACGELKTELSGVSGTGSRIGAPVTTGVKRALARATVAWVGSWAAISVSCDCAVPGTEAFTFSFGLVSAINAKSTGRSLPGTCFQGPARSGARNQRPVTRM